MAISVSLIGTTAGKKRGVKMSMATYMNCQRAVDFDKSAFSDIVSIEFRLEPSVVLPQNT